MKKSNFYVLPDEKESSEKRVNRFKKWFSRSRIAQIVKDERYRKGKKTKREIRKSALYREKFRAERERKKFYT